MAHGASELQTIVQFFCSENAYLQKLCGASSDRDWLNQVTHNGQVPLPEDLESRAQWQGLFANPDETAESLKSGGQRGNEAQDQLTGCFELFQCLNGNNAEFKASTASQCLVELVLYLLLSTDGNLEDWQHQLQAGVEYFVRNSWDAIHTEVTRKEREALDKWRRRVDKDELEHYSSIPLLSGYAKEEMPKKRRMCHRGIENEIQEALASKSGEFRVLSLGCGPGSDLLAVLDCWARANSQRPIACVGVDRQWWPRSMFFLDKTNFTMPNIKVSFIKQDIKTFIESELGKFTKRRFDLVILSFVGVGNLPDDILRTKLQNLLEEDGFVLVADNYISSVLSLTRLEFSYRPTLVWLSNDADKKPIIVFLRKNKKSDTAKLDVKVFYVYEDSVHLATVDSNMPPKMQLNVFVSVAKAKKKNENIKSSVEIDFRRKYPDSKFCFVRNEVHYKRDCHWYLRFRVAEMELFFQVQECPQSFSSDEELEESVDKRINEFFECLPSKLTCKKDFDSPRDRARARCVKRDVCIAERM